jgi:hypothetical protein
MRAIASVVLLFALGFGLSWAICGASVARLAPQQGAVDTQSASATVWRTEYRYLAWGRDPLATPRPKVLVFGHSAVREGFRPDVIASLLPGYDVHNLSLAAAEIREIREQFDRALEYLPPETVPGSIFVIGLHFGEFMANSYGYNQGLTNLSMAMLSSGLYRRVPGRGPDRAIAPLLPESLIASATTLVRPTFLAKETILNGTKALSERLSLSAVAAETADNPTGPAPAADGGPPESKRQEYLLFWSQYVGGDKIPTDRFVHLERMVAAIRARGGRVVLVDLPSPLWMTERCPLYADYQDAVAPLLARLTADPGVTRLDMRAMNDNATFRDSSHPVTAQWPVWSTVLAEYLRSQVRPPSNVGLAS